MSYVPRCSASTSSEDGDSPPAAADATPLHPSPLYAVARSGIGSLVLAEARPGLEGSPSFQELCAAEEAAHAPPPSAAATQPLAPRCCFSDYPKEPQGGSRERFISSLVDDLVERVVSSSNPGPGLWVDRIRSPQQHPEQSMLEEQSAWGADETMHEFWHLMTGVPPTTPLRERHVRPRREKRERERERARERERERVF